MKKLLILLLALLLNSSIYAQDSPTDNCLSCHESWEDEGGPSHVFKRDVHFQRGIGCSGCHGGDSSLDDMDDVRKSKGYIGIPTHFEIPAFCARCHSDPTYMREHNPSLPTDQLEKYQISVHGERLLRQKDAKVADCVSCHTAHSVASAKMPFASTHPLNLPYTCGACHADAEYMKNYGIPTDQLDDFVSSVHGVALLERHDLGAPACNDCHSNHGAAPPGVTSLSAVCGVCHAVEAQLYEVSPHEQAFSDAGLPMCESCHSNHAIQKPTDLMIGLSEQGICGDCHSIDDGTAAGETIKIIKAGIGDLLASADSARVLLANVRAKGMMTTEIEFQMKDVDQAIIQARTHIHAFTADSVMPRVEAGLVSADAAQSEAAALIDEYYFRRKGLVISTVVMTLLAVLLYAKIRRTESHMSD